MNQEIKVSDGIYITKPSKDSKQITNEGKILSSITKEDNSSNINNNNYIDCYLKTMEEKKPNYIYKNTSELIQILECEFIEYQEEVCLLKKSNEEMLEFDPNDYDLIQAREDNLVLINKRLEQLIVLQNKLREHCPTHPFVLKNVFDIISLIEESQNNPEMTIRKILNEKENMDSNTLNSRRVDFVNGNIDNVSNVEITGNTDPQFQEEVKNNIEDDIIKEIDL
jgi:hypothetical protein